MEPNTGTSGGGALELKTMELDITVEEDPGDDDDTAALAALLLGAMDAAEAEDATAADDGWDAEDGPEEAALVDDVAAALLEAATKDEPVADDDDAADAGVLVPPGREDADEAPEAMLVPEKDAAPELPLAVMPTAHTPLSQRASRPQSASALHVRTHCPSTWVSSAAQGFMQPPPAPNRSSTGMARQTEMVPFMTPRVPRPPSQRKELHVGVGGTSA